MVQPQAIHPNVQVNDITRQFSNAVSTLRPGQLVKDEQFTLFEAVSALEIGDPKMDSGSGSFDQDSEEEYDFTSTVSAEEIIWLMDELVCREAAWHMGYPLSQTLFTSVHLERLLWPEPKRLSATRFRRGDSHVPHPSSLLEDVFQPYCIALVKSCDLVHSMVTSHHYYEEEDFATQIFNRPLLHNFAVDEILALLQNARLWLMQSDLSPDLRETVAIRLNLRYSLLELLQCCTFGSRPRTEQFHESIESLKRMESTTTLGQPTNAESFTLKIQRKLASSVPPRPMIVIDREKAFAFFRQLIIDTTTAFQVLDIPSSGDLLVAYQNFMAQAVQPAVYVRALLQSFLILDNTILGHFTIPSFILQDIRALVLPISPLLDDAAELDDIPADQRFQISSQLDLFVERCGQSFLNLFRTFCLNRSRVRRTLCHAVLEWDQIQAEAEDLDGLVQTAFNEQPIPYPDEIPTFSYSFSSWVYHYKLVQLRTIIQMGFELSIYAPHEFAGMFWYLSFLSSTHLSHLERISHFVSSKRQIDSSQKEAVQTTLHHLYRHFTWLKASEALARALHRVFVVLQRHGLLTNPTPAYASDQLRYELRMRPFLHLSIPEPVSVDIAQEASSLRDLSDEVVLDQAVKLSQTARKAWEEVLREKWNAQPLAMHESSADSMHGAPKASTESVTEREWTKDVRNTMRACIGTGITISTLSKALSERRKGPRDNRAAGLSVEIPPVNDRDRWHVSWPVPKIRS